MNLQISIRFPHPEHSIWIQNLVSKTPSQPKPTEETSSPKQAKATTPLLRELPKILKSKERLITGKMSDFYQM